MASALPDLTSAPILLDQHRALIGGSAIDPAVAAERGYRSVTRPEELRQLGFSAAQCRVPALLVPIHGVRGNIASYQLRPDSPRVGDGGRAIKYETPRGSAMVLDVHPRVRGWLDDPTCELWITEGARKADSGISLGLCVIALLGVWNWRGKNEKGGLTTLADWEAIALNDRDVFVVFDSDVMTKPPVFEALKRLRSFLESRGAHIKVVYLPDGPDGAKVGLDDFIASGRDVSDLRRLASTELREPAGKRPGPAQPSRLILTPMSNVEPRPVEWLWPGMIPLGKLTILGGNGGVGKSTLALDIAARVTRGAELPDGGSKAPRGTVFVIAAEDDAADTVRPRLDAAGADVAKVQLIESVNQGSEQRAFRLPDDAPLLRDALAEHPDARLLIIDTVTDVLPGVDEHSNSEVRTALRPLAKLAADSGIAVLLIMHNRKAPGVSSQHRLHGSIAFGALARTTLQVWAVPGRPNEALLTKSKSNVSAMTGQSLHYRVHGEPPRLEWLGAVDVNADEAMREADDPTVASRGARETAESFVREALAAGPRPSKEIESEAKAAGIALRTLRRARESLGVESRPNGLGGSWIWKLATDARPQEPHSVREPGQVGQLCAEGPESARVAAH